MINFEIFTKRIKQDGATVFIILSDGESRDRAQYYDKKTFDYFKDITRMRIAVGVANADKQELVGTFILSRVNTVYSPRYSKHHKYSRFNDGCLSSYL